MATNYISLAGIELTDTGRTISQSLDKRKVSLELSDGSDVEYVKAIKNVWQIDWDWLPGPQALTTDGKAARDVISFLVSGLINVTPFILHNISGDVTHQVLVKDYKEDILRRDYKLNAIFYKVSLSLTEA